MALRVLCITVTVLLVLWEPISSREKSELNWRPSTPMSAARLLQRSVTQFNCPDMAKSRLRLPKDFVAQLPEFNTAQLDITYPNRTGLQMVHDMALNRAFFYSYILQTFNVSDVDYKHMPGLLYIYLSAASDVSANPKTINGSILLYDVSAFYPNWFPTMRFNTTFNLFAIRAIRVDNTFFGNNFLREPGLNYIIIHDLGAQDANYTHTTYRNAPWYGKEVNDPGFLPDSYTDLTSGVKRNLFNFDIYWDPLSREGRSFFGPPYSGQLETQFLPVRFTRPWFDCGSGRRAFNEWVVSGVSPVVDVRPRYSRVIRLQRPRYVAVAAMDTYFLNIPVNLCPLSKGNTAPNMLAGSSTCRPSTVCESRLRDQDIQFRSSSYFCRCAAGYRYPYYIPESWYTGSSQRRATLPEYKVGFHCEKIGNLMVWPASEGLLEIGPPNPGNAIDVQLMTRRRRDTQQVAENKATSSKPSTEHVYVTDHAERMAQVEATLRQHFNVSSLKEIFGQDNAHNDEMASDTVLQKAQRLVSTFSQPASAAHQHLRHRFNADWLLTRSSDTESSKLKQKLHSRTKRMAPPMPDTVFNEARHKRMYDIFARTSKITSNNCHQFKPHEMILPGPTGFGADKQFHNQASTALRLAHFLSSFYQLNKGGNIVSGIRMGQELHEHHIIGEALGNVAGNVDIVSSGVFFDREVFVDSKGVRRTYFGPLIYQKGAIASLSFEARETSRFGSGYHQKPWFRLLKERWATNAYGLDSFTVFPHIRGREDAKDNVEYPYYPMWFKAPRLSDGHWTEPYFDCDGPVKDWIMTYAVPFFGRNAIGLQFKGVVSVSVSLSTLNVNQCPGPYYQSNYFKDTALCDQTSTYCVPTFGLGFTWGSYECHCRQGYEFPYMGPRYFFLGSLAETEWKKRLANKPNIFGILKCREAAGMTLQLPSWWMYIILLVVSLNSRSWLS